MTRTVLQRLFTRIRFRKLLNVVGLTRRKVFAIGFNKTGTTSLHAMFQSLSIPSYHGPKWRMGDDTTLRRHTFFSDNPPTTTDALVELDRRFPKSRFLLQVRELDSWVFSRLAHIDMELRQRPNRKRSPMWDKTPDAVDHWIRNRNEWHVQVMNYFAERGTDLLIVNFVRDPDAAGRICRWLGLPAVERPRKNVGKSERPAEYRDMLDASAARLGVPEDELSLDLLCPSLLDPADRGKYPVDTRELE